MYCPGNTTYALVTVSMYASVTLAVHVLSRDYHLPPTPLVRVYNIWNEINKGVIEDDQKYDGGIRHMIKSIVPRGLMSLLLIRLGIKLYLE